MSILLGAHVSTAGGVDNAPARGKAIGATAIQVFTKTPNQWREPTIATETADRFRSELSKTAVEAVVSHDSYLINLASPDRSQRSRSIQSFVQELTRCKLLGIPWVVTHPGNYMTNLEKGLARNAKAYTACLERVDDTGILIETTAGTGTALGSRFQELAELRANIPTSLRKRVGFCVDTCHIFSAGYDIREDWDGVWKTWDELIGIEHIHCFHLNDSKTPFDSHRDRHELIGEGSLGPEPFRNLMRDERFKHIMKVIETPKGDDLIKTDRRMLRRLRAYAKPPKRETK